MVNDMVNMEEYHKIVNGHYDYSIITVCTHMPHEPYYCLNEFAKSLKGEQLIVLDREYTNYSGLGSKPKGVYRAIKEGAIKSKYILFTDCWDFVFAESPKALMRSYFENYPDVPLVISAEKNCFPADLKDEYDTLSGKPYRYLNSGMIVGETEAFLEVLEAMDLKNVPEDYRKEDGNMCHINDQFLYQEIFVKQPVKIELDYDQKLCCTLHATKLEDLDFKFSRIRNKITDSYPCSFHFNGSGKTDGCREPILKHLNLI
jgi:hypothetical protein